MKWIRKWNKIWVAVWNTYWMEFCSVRWIQSGIFCTHAHNNSRFVLFWHSLYHSYFTHKLVRTYFFSSSSFSFSLLSISFSYFIVMSCERVQHWYCTRSNRNNWHAGVWRMHISTTLDIEEKAKRRKRNGIISWMISVNCSLGFLLYVSTDDCVVLLLYLSLLLDELICYA